MVGASKGGIGSLFTVRRTTIALLIGFAVAGLGAAALGLAEASDGAPTGMPAVFGVPLPNVGDRGEYSTITYEERPDGVLVPVGGDRRFYRFEWLPPRDIPDSEGIVRTVNAVRATLLGAEGAYEDNLNSEFLFDAATSRRIGTTLLLTNGTATTGLTGSTMLRWHQSARLYGTAGSLLCGIQSQLQGNQVDTRIVHEPFGNCSADGGLFAMPGTDAYHVNPEGLWKSPITRYRAVGVERFEEEAAVVFQSGIGMRVWFVPSTPYPIKMVVPGERTGQDGESSTRVYDVVRLVAFGRGQEPIPRLELSATGVAAPPLTYAERERYGPRDLVDHPFPLSRAWEIASSEGALREFLNDHRDAAVTAAYYEEVRQRDEVIRSWSMKVAEEVETLAVRLEQTTLRPQAPGAPAAIGELLSGTETFARYGYDNASAVFVVYPAPPVDCLDRLPTVRSLWELWRFYAPPRLAAERPNAWGFDIQDDLLSEERCDMQLSFTAGIEVIDAGSPTPTLSSWTESTQIGVGADGRVKVYRERTSTGEFQAGIGPAPDTAAPEPQTGLESQDVRVNSWTFPEGRAAAGVGLLGLVAGAAYWLWPLVRTGFGAIPLFSRIVSPQALRHPVRGNIHALLVAEPGLHVHEIARRLEVPRGTVEHHLEKLVQVGLLVPQPGRGFTCYFPKGAVDRRVMAAAPVLKAEGAQKILAQVLATPNVTAGDVAFSCGLSAPTVTYHLKRLAAAGLVALDRAGKQVRVRPNELAREALSVAT